MARPQKEGMDYFPHDTDASVDEKLEALRSIHGNDGYAFYFILLERIYRSAGAELDVSDAETRQILARKVAVTDQKFSDMLSTALKWGCFDREIYEKSGVLTSNGIKKRAQIVIDKRLEMKERYQKAKLNKVSTSVSDAETIPETPQSKVKKSKVKKSNKENIIKEISKKPYGEFLNVFLTDGELKKLNERFGEGVAKAKIEHLSAGIKSKGYRYRDHYATILTWDRRDQKEGNGNGTNQQNTKRPCQLIDRTKYTRPEDA